ncbi:hypothetical protein CGC48_02260 [Capnocytophaga cynodegmi]|uniref:EF-hand domain-containing protein n=1 Tax=Capnocytophaga cynodegmi TaxID=28189 RepID=A0A250E721_9FLAO|nr:hypothetical protein [Capnocytophaga cynodegmi]ATA67555.1 hypothetical protein CGC48_02260 [Capnocytophaga cynodegmi]
MVCHYHDKTGNRIERKGWIKDSDKLEKFSAYHWDKFGFKMYDAENHRMYPIKSVNNYEGTSEFIKKIIALIDKNKDGKIQNEELQASYNKPELSHIFSKMVCKHKSEWSYKWAKIKSDYEKFIKYHYPKAKQEYVDERLDEIQAKYDALYDFWDKLNFKTDTFWYFEPFAWVEQMKRVFSSIKSDIDLRDKIEWQTQFDSQWGDSNAQSVACWKTCQQILTKSGLGAKSGYLADAIVLAREINNNTELEYVTENLEKSKEYLDAELEKGNPILIGVIIL